MEYAYDHSSSASPDKTRCGIEKQPWIKAKKLSAPIGSPTMKLGVMRCENCRRSVTATLNALYSIVAKVSLESGTASVFSPLSATKR